MCTIDRRQAGFSFIELIIFIVVVSAGLSGVLMVMDVSVKSSADPLLRKQTVAAAESLLEEIMLKKYADPAGGYTGTNRALFDDVGDYAGYSTTGGIVDFTGASIAALSRYNVSSVTVVPLTLNSINVKRVTVTVTGPAGSIDLTSYKTNY
ncbi:MAG: prepilin-type N-terminal cleavage/methylation domain-containing protein [Hylemonella sp.]|nr:prepilin-type N-terminal cleavage/methylation domain-containing protein [Hylemonella sp.]MDH5709319.1 prepilin-type N-terminal cleavage/methylation domain-containing protein [Hylemonella sp.]